MENLLNRILEKDGCKIHYWTVRQNGKPWLIFLHGAGLDHQMFADQLPVLRGRFSLLLVDARGHGLSRPMGKEFCIQLFIDDLMMIMSQEKISKATFIGQSLGGNIAQEIAFFYPDKVESLVLIGCTCNTMKLSSLEGLLLKISPRILSYYPWHFLLKQIAEVSALSQPVRDYIKEAINTMGKKDFVHVFSQTLACLHNEDGYKIPKDVLLLCGKHDHTGNIKRVAPKWAELDPRYQFYFIEDAAHCANQDNPNEVNRILLNFLNTHYNQK